MARPSPVGMVEETRVTEENVTRPPEFKQPPANGGNVGERLARLEAHLEHLATKEGLGEIKTLISDREAKMLRWLIGITSVAAISLVAAIVRTFV